MNNTDPTIQKLREIVIINIGHAVQGVQEYKPKDLQDYYANKAKWIEVTTNEIIKTFLQTHNASLEEIVKSGPKRDIRDDPFVVDRQTVNHAKGFNAANKAWRNHIISKKWEG